MQQLTPKLGARVVTKGFLTRGVSYGRDEYHRQTRLKTWNRVECMVPIHGIYVGRRLKSNGTTYNHGEDGIEYKPVAYFEAWMVAFEDNRDILLCLPSDVVLEQYWRKEDE
jgi:hypothetical protein